MEDQLYRMIEHDIELLLDDDNGIIDVVQSSDSVSQSHFESENNASYIRSTNSGSAAYQEPLLSQHAQCSTVQSDEWNICLWLMHYMNDLTNLIVDLCDLYSRMQTKGACSFCKKNGMHFAVYTSHLLRINGIITCPYLLNIKCLHCRQNGHTTSHCLLKQSRTRRNQMARSPMGCNRRN